MSSKACSIVREIVTRSYTRYTPTNGRAPEGTEYGVDGWLFTLPGETLNGRRFPQSTYAAYQVSERGMLFWQVREVGGERRQIGSRSTTRKGARSRWRSARLPTSERRQLPRPRRRRRQLATRAPGRAAPRGAWPPRAASVLRCRPP
ncbi:hypothetical protein [Streptomyces kronopolitis]|uniref:hypothetical protein n=1 Tax=Streptomyces kronopolitis TaxID=1612435 RepID=UPI003D97FA0A